LESYHSINWFSNATSQSINKDEFMFERQNKLPNF